MENRGVKTGVKRGPYTKKVEIKEKPLELKINPTFSPLFSDNLEDPRYYQVYGGRGCFLKDQKIVLKNGNSKNISKINIGDIVKSYNIKKNCVEDKKVINKFRYDSNEYLKIKLKNGSIIKCTPDHKFLYKGEWIKIETILKMKFGVVSKQIKEIRLIRLKKAHSIELDEIESYEYIKDDVFVYDIEVEDNHSFLLENQNTPIIVHNSGKSFAASVAIVMLTYSKYKHKILYLRETMSSSEDSTIADVMNAISILKLNADFRKVKNSFTNIKTGSTIAFKGIRANATSTAKLKSLSGITTLVIEEAEELKSFEEFSKIDESIRVKGKPIKIILLYNPGSALASWIHKVWFTEGLPKRERTDTMYLHSTYLDNLENLNASTIDLYESLKKTNPIYYKNTILAEWTLDAEGRVYAGWKMFNTFDNEGETWYGLDFGYGGHDKTSLIKITYFEKVYYIQQVFSKSGLKISDWVNEMVKGRVPFNAIIYADSACPLLIKELCAKGFTGIRNAQKGNVEAGIKKIQDKEIVLIGDESTGLYFAYKTFSRDKFNNLPHEPDELAALRYGINSHRPFEKKAIKSRRSGVIECKGFI